MRDNKNDPTPYAVSCKGDSIPGQQPCGLVFLDNEAYTHQMCCADRGWFCPNCGSTASWDDDCQETNPPPETNEDDNLSDNDKHGVNHEK